MSNRVEILKKIELYKNAHPEIAQLSDAQIISVMIDSGAINLTEDERITIFGENQQTGLSDNVTLKQTSKISSKNGRVIVSLSNGKSFDINKTIENRINNITKNLKKAEDSNGFIGSMWSGFKNLTGIGDSSDKVRALQEKEKKLLSEFNKNAGKRSEIFKELTGADYNAQNLEKFVKGEIALKSEQALNGYTEGQEMASDITGDIISGIASVGIYSLAVAAAPVTGGASIAVGLAAATASGGFIKTAVKALDAKSGGREYTKEDAKHDIATGAFSGVLAPVTGGLGGAVGKTVATKLGVQAVKQVGKETAEEVVSTGLKQGIKTALTNPAGYEYTGSTMLKRATALSAEMATDGAVGGAVDSAFRTAYDGGSAEEVAESALGGFLGGALLSPVIGGGMKTFGSLGHKAGGEIKEFSEKELAKMIKEVPKSSKNGLPVNSFKHMKKAPANNNLNLKLYSKSPIVQKGVSRFTDKQAQDLLSQVNNPYLNKNKKLAKELLDKLSNEQTPGSLISTYDFMDFQIADVLSAVNEKNAELVDIMLKARHKDGRVFLPDNFSACLKALSEGDIEISKNLIKMYDFGTACPDDITQLVTLANKYPEEFKFLSSNYESWTILRFFNAEGDEAEDLLKFIQTCPPEKKELAEILCSEQVGLTDNKLILDLLNSNTGLNNKQIITMIKNFVTPEDVSQTLQKIECSGGKEISVSSDNFYKKQKPMSSEEIYAYVKQQGLSEEECQKFCRSEYAGSLIESIKFNEAVEYGLLGPIQPIDLLKEFLQNKDANTDILELMEKCAPYLSKENIDLYKATHKDFDILDFYDDLAEKALITDSYKNIPLISKCTGRTFYKKDTACLGLQLLKLQDLNENDIISSINKLKELNLYDENTNILTYLTKAKELSELEVTPEIKDFASFLSANKYLDEEAIVVLLKTVQAKDSRITGSKIAYIKNLIENEKIAFAQIPEIINNLSSNDFELVTKQIKAIEEHSAKYKELRRFRISEFLKTESIEEFDLYKKVLDSLIDTSDTGKILARLNDTSGSKAELAKLVVALRDRKIDISDIKDTLQEIHKYDKNKQMEFSALYLKGLDTDLGTLKDSYRDILKLHISDISSLNIKDRLKLYDRISSVDKNGKRILKQLGLDYDKLYEKVINSLGEKRKLVTLPKESNQLFIKQIIANNNPVSERVLKEFDFAQFGKEGLPLKYSRADFNSKVEELLKELTEKESEIILKHFGLERGTAGFDGIWNNRAFDSTEVSENARKIAGQIQKEIENFTLKNEVMIEDEAVKEVLDGLTKGLPEFTSVVGKKQHSTHSYSLDIHTLKVLQSAMNDPLYKTLNDRDKTILKYSILLHDLGKKGGVRDEGHAGLSADYTLAILDRYPFPSSIKDRVIDIVDNHHWFEKYNTGASSAEDVAVRCRRPEDLKIYEIFSKADFENVNPEFHLGAYTGGAKTQAEFDTYMKNKFADIEEAVNKIYTKANLVFDTQFMHSGSKFPSQKVEINGKMEELHVLNFSELADGEDLAKYGFAPGVTKEDARFFVHMTEPNHVSFETVFRLTNTPIFQSTWSSSLIKAVNNNTYFEKKFGLVLDIPQANISEAYFKNSGSGTEKGLDRFKYFLFGSRKETSVDGKTLDIRHWVKNHFIEEMKNKGYNLTDKEYAALSQYLFSKKYLSQINNDVQAGDKLISAEDLKDALAKSRDSLFEGNEHSEIIPINPKVKGVFAKVENLEDCPQEFLEFAKEHELPVILMKPSKQNNDTSPKLNKLK